MRQFLLAAQFPYFRGAAAQRKRHLFYGGKLWQIIQGELAHHVPLMRCRQGVHEAQLVCCRPRHIFGAIP